MSIEEKYKVLEFGYVFEDDPEHKRYNITYNKEAVESITISCDYNRKEISCPIQLLEEVIEYLKKKEIIGNNSPSIPVLDISQVSADGQLPIPNIENEDQSSNVSEPVEPLSSFDISNIAKISEEKKEVKKSEGDGPVISKDSNSEIVNRPVIRLRANEEDPLSAEKEAAAIRGKGEAGEKKTIKRKQEDK